MATIVMTGGTSGIGAVAAGAIARSGEHRLVLGGRGPGGDGGGERLPLDLASLAGVRSFADEVAARTGRVDVLVLNAGVYRPDVRGRTVDGFETTFAVNHLGHYLLLRLLDGLLADGARIVLTASGVHDPAERTPFPPPRHADAELLAHPDRDPGLDPDPRTAGRHAYAASKLATLLTTRALAVRPDGRARRLRVVAYCPGETPGTGLVRDDRLRVRLAWRLAGSVLRPVVPQLSSVAEAGQGLADLALGVVDPPEGRRYAALRRGRITFPDPSELARRDDVATTLWHDSARLVGLPAPV